jgi:hypothetical protein
MTPRKLASGTPIDLVWADACTGDIGWEAAPVKNSVAEIESRGFVAGCDSKALVISHSRHVVENAVGVCDTLSIPWGVHP